jgi:hypothetical protein
MPFENQVPDANVAPLGVAWQEIELPEAEQAKAMLGSPVGFRATERVAWPV